MGGRERLEFGVRFERGPRLLGLRQLQIFGCTKDDRKLRKKRTELPHFTCVMSGQDPLVRWHRHHLARSKGMRGGGAFAKLG